MGISTVAGRKVEIKKWEYDPAETMIEIAVKYNEKAYKCNKKLPGWEIFLLHILTKNTEYWAPVVS